MFAATSADTLEKYAPAVIYSMGFVHAAAESADPLFLLDDARLSHLAGCLWLLHASVGNAMRVATEPTLSVRQADDVLTNYLLPLWRAPCMRRALAAVADPDFFAVNGDAAPALKNLVRVAGPARSAAAQTLADALLACVRLTAVCCAINRGLVAKARVQLAADLAMLMHTLGHAEEVCMNSRGKKH